MRMPNGGSWVPLALIAAVLASILAFLYVRTRGYDASSYYENIALLRQLQQLDARWELDVLKSRMGIQPNYDSLVDPLTSLNDSWGRLREIIADHHDAAHDPLTRAGDAYHRAVEEKTRLIEHFKSQNAVLRNSLAFLPTAAQDVSNALATAHGRGELEQLRSRVSRILLESLVYSEAPSDDKATDIRSEIAELTARSGTLPAPIKDAVAIFAAHVGTLLKEQPEVNASLRSIALVPIATKLDELNNLTSGSQRAAELQSQRYRKYLFIFAAALAALLLYVVVKLIRSHREVHSVNQQLEAANETLEERVQERTRELRQAQGELVTAARHAGMAEIAANVLHNVGNVLNSVNVSADLVSARARDSKVKGLADAMRLMSEHEGDLAGFLTRDDKGMRLPAYLNKLAEVLTAEKKLIVEEMTSLKGGIEHIRDIVATQQSFAGATGVTEPVHLGDLLQDALRMNASLLARHETTVLKDWDGIPEVLLDKHLVLQIMVNLVANALQAMENITDRPRRLTLKAETPDGAEGPRLRIHVNDNGEGILPENLPRLFTHGFTTRKGGHGFGLHSCALAARAMNGHLTVHSPGPGSGASFMLDVPLREVAVKAIMNL
jgi:two-component system NtrC family sensor kinase